MGPRHVEADGNEERIMPKDTGGLPRSLKRSCFQGSSLQSSPIAEQAAERQPPNS